MLQIRELRDKEVEYLAQSLELEILLNNNPSSPLRDFFPHPLKKKTFNIQPRVCMWVDWHRPLQFQPHPSAGILEGRDN